MTDLTTSARQPDDHLLRTMAMAEFAEILRGSPWADCRHTETALRDLQTSANMAGAAPTILTTLDMLPQEWNANCAKQ